MENSISHETEGLGLPEVPSLAKCMPSNDVVGFYSGDFKNLSLYSKERETTSAGIQDDEAAAIKHQSKHSVSISIPLSCEEVHLHNTIRVLCSAETAQSDGVTTSSSQSTTKDSKPPLPPKCCSKPMPNGSVHSEATCGDNFVNHESIKGLKFDSFKTWSGTLHGQLSILSGRLPKIVEEDNNLSNTDKPLPVDCYFKSLEGPQLETPKKSSEEMVLPQDNQWPFLLRFPASSFGICLGVSSQAILWKALAMSPSTEFLHITLKINLILWFIAIALVVTIFTIYLFKIFLYFEAVRREYYHYVRVNFLFAPWLSLLFLALGIPPSVVKDLHHALWYILMIPLFCLQLKIYGQWMFGGQRKLSNVANPTNLLSIIGNFVGALLGASMGLKEGPLFFYAIGLAHYLVVFVTLYQMLPTNKTIPKELHPVFFLFVAPPSVASLAWARIQGSFNYGSMILYFISMFLYLSLAVRVNLFRGFKFSLSWWAYTFPMTAAAIATTTYSNQVPNGVTKALCVILSLISTFTVTAILVLTIVHAFVLRDLFPNDLAIATSDRKRKPHRKQFHPRNGSYDGAKKSENYLKFVNSDKNDLDA